MQEDVHILLGTLFRRVEKMASTVVKASPFPRKKATSLDDVPQSGSSFEVGEGTAQGYSIPARPSPAQDDAEDKDYKLLEYTMKQYGVTLGMPEKKVTLPPLLEAARRYVDVVQPASQFVPFPFASGSSLAYPRHDSLMQAYYFYWRDNFRNGTVLPSDDGYIQLYMYECVHLVGFEDAEQAFQEIFSLWKHYRAHHKRTEVKLRLLLLPMIAYYDLPYDPLIIMAEVAQLGGAIPGALAREIWLQKPDMRTLSFDMMVFFGKFNMCDGKLYDDFSDKELLLRCYQDVFAVVDSYYQKTKRQSLFKDLMRKDYSYISAYIIQTVAFDYPRKYADIARYHEVKTRGNACKLLENALKYAENFLRKQRKVRGSRQGVEVVDELKVAIAKALEKRLGIAKEAERNAKPVQRRKVSLDKAKLKNLSQDSEHIRAQLIQEDEAEADAASVTVDAKNVSVDKMQENAVVHTEGVSSEKDGGVAEGWLELCTALNPFQRDMLHHILDEAEDSVLERIASQHFSMKDLLIEEINELSMTWLEDNIIDPYSSPISIYDEHLEALRQSLTESKAEKE